MTPPVKDSVWAPLRVRAFRLLWLTQLGSMIGTWMHNVGAQWLLIDEPGAETLVALVQAAAMLPVLVLALPAGALADIVDRRRMLIGVQVFQAVVGAALLATTLAGRLTPAALLTITFLLGCGITVTIPAFQAMVQDLVPGTQLRSVAGLNGVAINLARAVGPPLAGVLIAYGGCRGRLRAQPRQLCRPRRRAVAAPPDPRPSTPTARAFRRVHSGQARATSGTRHRSVGSSCAVSSSWSPERRCGHSCR